MDIQALGAKYHDYLIEMRRWFHANPEVSCEEFNTSARIKEELDKMGIAWRPCGLKTGVMVTIEGGKPGKRIMLREDIDALTVNEETGLEYASKNPGVMHACGHDCHIAILLAVAGMLNEIKDELCGTVVLAFQPAEENAKGALGMMQEGLLDGVDVCFGMHVWSDIPSGKISVRDGAAMASADQFIIDIEGVSGHGATPHLCADVVPMTSAIIQSLQTVVSREIDPTETAVLTVGTIQAGTRWNVIAGKAQITGTTRCFSNAVRDQFPEAIERIASQTAAAYRGSVKCQYNGMVPPTINDAKFAALVRSSAKKVLGEDALYDYPLTMGGEDFGYYQQKIPGVMVLFGVGNPACDAVHPQHSCYYKVDEDALIKGAMTHVQIACDFLNG